MKLQNTLLASAVSALLLVTSGCGKKEEAVSHPVPAPTATDSAPAAFQKAVATAQAQTEVVKQKATEITAAVKDQANAASAQVQGLIEQARKLISENKWTEALALLNNLGGQSLAPEQQTLVQSLKAQVQKAIEAAAKSKMADEAGKAAGGFLQPK